MLYVEGDWKRGTREVVSGKSAAEQTAHEISAVQHSSSWYDWSVFNGGKPEDKFQAMQQRCTL